MIDATIKSVDLLLLFLYALIMKTIYKIGDLFQFKHHKCFADSIFMLCRVVNTGQINLIGVQGDPIFIGIQWCNRTISVTNTHHITRTDFKKIVESDHIKYFKKINRKKKLQLV